MQSVDVVVKSSVPHTFRCEAVRGKFDLDIEEIVERFRVEYDFDFDWNVGAIVGASGSGKTTITKRLFGEDSISTFFYDDDKPVIDTFSEAISIDEITALFNSVGFSSPPSWLKPYRVLSNGEQMRVDLVSALLKNDDVVVFDEFTSVVDRTVAKISSAAVVKAVRRRSRKFVAVACHFDILRWLEPDWVIDMNSQTFSRRRLRRPKIEIRIFEERGKWELFRKYHYLDSHINKSSVQYVGYVDNEPVAFCAFLHFPHPRLQHTKRVHRLVVRPDYQGVGIGRSVLNYLCEKQRKNGNNVIITTSSHSMILSLQNDKRWIVTRFGHVSDGGKTAQLKNTASTRRLTVSFKYRGDKEHAKR